MNMKKLVLAAFVCCTIIASSVTSQLSAQDVNLEGVKCIINGNKAASVDAVVDYKGGKVYFCCQGCVKKFKADVELKEEAKFATKANHQLVVTGQFTQKGCPMSGGPVNEEFMTEVGGAKVGFCCGNCQKKVVEAEGLAAKADLVFSEVAFKKAFEKKSAEINLENVKCMMMPKKAVSADTAVDYKGGKVHFCCKGCAKKFAAKTEEYAVGANQHLVTTGQFEQTACPISGGSVDDAQVSVVGGRKIKFCCEKCKAKVDEAADEQAKAALVFDDKRFAKAFAKKGNTK